LLTQGSQQLFRLTLLAAVLWAVLLSQHFATISHILLYLRLQFRVVITLKSLLLLYVFQFRLFLLFFLIDGLYVLCRAVVFLIVVVPFKRLYVADVVLVAVIESSNAHP
jgi:hypothetical protein